MQCIGVLAHGEITAPQIAKFKKLLDICVKKTFDFRQHDALYIYEGTSVLFDKKSTRHIFLSCDNESMYEKLARTSYYSDPGSSYPFLYLHAFPDLYVALAPNREQGRALLAPYVVPRQVAHGIILP